MKTNDEQWIAGLGAKAESLRFVSSQMLAEVYNVSNEDLSLEERKRLLIDVVDMMRDRADLIKQMIEIDQRTTKAVDMVAAEHARVMEESVITSLEADIASDLLSFAKYRALFRAGMQDPFNACMAALVSAVGPAGKNRALEQLQDVYRQARRVLLKDPSRARDVELLQIMINENKVALKHPKSFNPQFPAFAVERIAEREMESGEGHSAH